MWNSYFLPTNVPNQRTYLNAHIYIFFLTPYAVARIWTLISWVALARDLCEDARLTELVAIVYLIEEYWGRGFESHQSLVILVDSRKSRKISKRCATFFFFSYKSSCAQVHREWIPLRLISPKKINSFKVSSIWIYSWEVEKKTRIEGWLLPWKKEA